MGSVAGGPLTQLGQNISRIGQTMAAMRERDRYRRTDSPLDMQYDALRNQQLQLQLAMLQQEAAAMLVYSPTEKARVEREKAEAQRQLDFYQEKKAANDAAASAIELTIKEATKDAEIVKATTAAQSGQWDVLTKQHDLQKKLIDAISPSDEEMQVIAKYFPERARSFETLKSTMLSNILPMDEFQKYLSGMDNMDSQGNHIPSLNELLIMPIDDKVAASLGFEPGTELDLQTFANNVRDRRFGYDKIEKVFANLAVVKDTDPEQYKSIVSSVFGTEEMMHEQQKLMAAEGMDLFQSPMMRTHMNQNIADVQADIAAKSLAEKNGKGGWVSTVWDWATDLTPRNLIMGSGDYSHPGSSDWTAEHQRQRKDDLEPIRQSAPDLPGFSFGGGGGKGFTLEGPADTGVTSLYDPVRRKVVDINTEGYKYELPEAWQVKVRQAIGEDRWKQVMGITNLDRRRAVLAHYEAKLPGGFNSQAIAENPLSVFAQQYIKTPLGIPITYNNPRMEGLHNGMVEEFLDEPLAVDAALMLGGSAASRMLGAAGRPLAKAASRTKLGRKILGTAVKGMATPPPLPPALPPPLPSQEGVAAGEAIGKFLNLSNYAPQQPGKRAIDTMMRGAATPPPLPMGAPTAGPMVQGPTINPFRIMAEAARPPSAPVVPQMTPNFSGLGGMAEAPTIAPYASTPPRAPGAPITLQQLFPKPAGPLLPAPSYQGVRMPNPLDFIGRSNVAARMQGAGRLHDTNLEARMLDDMLSKNIKRTEEIASKSAPKPKPKSRKPKKKK